MQIFTYLKNIFRTKEPIIEEPDQQEGRSVCSENFHQFEQDDKEIDSGNDSDIKKVSISRF